MTEGSPPPADTHDDVPAEEPLPSAVRRRWPVVAGIVAVFLVLSLVIYLGGWLGGTPEDPDDRSSAEVSAQDMEIDFDIDSASFFLPADNRPYLLFGDRYPFDLEDRDLTPEPVRFTDGAYYPGGAEDDPHMRLAEGTEPLFTDVNGDSNTDVVAVLEYTGVADERFTAWKGVFVWLWEDGKAVPLQRLAGWQWVGCPAESDLTVELDGLSRLPRVTRTGDGNCDGDANDSQGENPAPQTVYVRDGVPISVGHASGAVDRCYLLNMYKKDADYTVTAEVTPRLAPDAEAPEIDGTVLKPEAGGTVAEQEEEQRIDAIQLRVGPKPDRELYDGWVPVNIVWSEPNQPITCGWVNWSEVGKKFEKD